MKFGDILRTLKPIASIAASFIPGGSAAIELVNSFLPKDKQLPPTATGQQVIDAHDRLPPETQLALRQEEVKLEIAREEGWSERYKAMTQADGQSTRPKIALIMAWMLAIPYVLIGVLIAYAIGTKSVDLAEMWPTLLAYLGVPLGILNKYFGELRREQNQRSAVVSGIASPLGLIEKLFK